MFNEANLHLSEVLESTEKATMRVMELVERQMDLQIESADLLASLKDGAKPDALKRLLEINTQLGDDLSEILTSLSFQDLTGQRIKKVINALKTVESALMNMYLSSGLLMDGLDKHPEFAKQMEGDSQKAIDAFRQSRNEVADVINNVKKDKTQLGPSNNGKSQSDIDSLLSQLGL